MISGERADLERELQALHQQIENEEGAKTESGDRETNTERQTGDSIYMGRYKSVTFVASLF